MAAIAYVLISSDIGAEKEVLGELMKIPEVEEAYIVYGVYDIVAKIRVDSEERLREVIISRIRTLGKIKSTLTMKVVEGFERK